MIYNIDAKFLFIHIPRTGGISVTQKLLQHFPDSYVDTTVHRHRYAVHCQDLDRLRDLWGQIYKFAIIRNPWVILESDFKLCMRDIATLHTYSKMVHYEQWYKKLERASTYKSFSEYVAREYLGRDIVWEGGFWKTWCCDYEGVDLGVNALRFEHLNEDWLRVCRQLDLPLEAVSKTNSSDGLTYPWCFIPLVYEKLGVKSPELPKIDYTPPYPCCWTPSVRDAIGELCCQDVEKFGYEFQGQLA